MNEIRVWDPLVRIFHWSLVVAFTVAYFSGEEESLLHIYSGYAVMGLVVFRLVWGSCGTRYARFSEFVYSPKTVFFYIKSLVDRKPLHYIGHNPAGGWMIMAILLCLIVVTVSGLKVYAIEEGRGPLAQSSTGAWIISNVYADDDDDDEMEEDEEHQLYSSENQHHSEKESEDFWEEIHELSADFMLFLIFLHISGVLISSYLHNENLIKSMITGKKAVQDYSADQ